MVTTKSTTKKPAVKKPEPKVKSTFSTTWEEILFELEKPFPEEAIEKTKGRDTGKGYDTTGIGYQWIVDRLNNVIGPAHWGFDFNIAEKGHGTAKTAKGRVMHGVTIEITIWIKVGDQTAERKCIGGHQSTTFADAYKGAVTNAFKKTIALFGAGSSVYRGMVDDDNEKMASEDIHPEDKPRTVGGATEKQVQYICTLMTKCNIDRADYMRRAKLESMNDLTPEQATNIIDKLKKKEEEITKQGGDSMPEIDVDTMEPTSPADFPPGQEEQIKPEDIPF